MKFSIIIPVYNSESSLWKCVNSVLAQSYQDWEMILVDDGSTDGSGDICNQLAEADKRIHIIHQKNQGQLFARRSGIQRAQGDYLLFLDSDDYWHTNCLSILDGAIKDEAPDVIMFPAKRMGDTRSEYDLICNISEDREWIDKTRFYTVLISGPDFNSLCLKAWRRDLFAGDNTDYSRFRNICWGEDRVQLLHPITNAKRILFIPDVLYYYVDNPTSVTHTVNTDSISKMLANDMFALLYEYVKLWDMDFPKYRESIAVQYLRNYINIYYKVRKLCKTKQGKMSFRRFCWKAEVSQKAFRYMFSKELTYRERIKLVIARYNLI